MPIGGESISARVLESLPPIAPSISIGGGIGASLSSSSSRVTTAAAAANANINNRTTAAATAPSATAAVIPPPYIRLGNRTIHTSSSVRSWSWKSFSSTARPDGAQFHHWVPSSVEYADYPYARFDVHLDPLVYSSEEYEKYLESGADVDEGIQKEMELIVRGNNSSGSGSSSGDIQQKHLVHSKVYPWTKSETDTLLDLARLYDLRWPIIIDKWRTQFANVPSCQLRQIEDLQYRYYEVGMILAARRAREVLANEVELVDKKKKEKEEDMIKKEGVIVQPSMAVMASSVVKAGGAGDIGGGDVTVPTAVTAVDNAAKAKDGDGLVISASNTVDTTTTVQMASSTSNSAEQQTQQPDKEVVEALHRTHRQVTIDPSLVPPLSLPATGTSTHRLRGSGGAGAVGVGIESVKGAVFDLLAERARRAHLDRLWHRSKEEEMEEEGLRAELRLVEAQLRKLKRSGKHLVPAGSASAAATSKSVSSAGGGGKFAVPTKGLGGIGGEDVVPAAASSSMLPPPSNRTIMPPPPPISSASMQTSSHRPPLDPFANTHQSVSASFVETAPVPTPGTPYLQSGRLFPPSVKGHTGLNPNTLKQMNAILKELNIPEEPIPTKRNCDLYDGVRKDALTLLILQKIALRKEGELDSKRSVLCEIKSAAKAAAEAAKAAAEAAAAAAALAAAEEAEKKQKKNAENAVEKKEAGNAEAEGGGKAKKAPAKRASKAKRPRDESTSSNQGGGDAATATTAKGAGGKGSTPKKEKDGSAPKKRSRTKAKKDTTTPAATATAPAPTGSSNASAPGVSSGVPTAKFAPPPPPPPTAVAMTSASVSPMVPKSRPTTAKDSSSVPLSLPPPSSGNIVGAIVGASIDPSSSAAPPSTATAAAAAAIYPGKTANKPGRKPRGRKKAEAQNK